MGPQVWLSLLGWAPPPVLWDSPASHSPLFLQQPAHSWCLVNICRKRREGRRKGRPSCFPAGNPQRSSKEHSLKTTTSSKLLPIYRCQHWGSQLLGDHGCPMSLTVPHCSRWQHPREEKEWTSPGTRVWSPALLLPLMWCQPGQEVTPLVGLTIYTSTNRTGVQE